MTKSELIEKIAAKNPSLTVKEIDRIVTVILDSEKLSVDARNIPHFKAGKQLYELLNKAK